MKFVIYAQVDKIEEKFISIYQSGSGHGPDAKFETASQGWFVHLKGSHEAIFLGADKPPIAGGDTVKITIERIDAQPKVPEVR